MVSERFSPPSRATSNEAKCMPKREGGREGGNDVDRTREKGMETTRKGENGRKGKGREGFHPSQGKKKKKRTYTDTRRMPFTGKDARWKTERRKRPKVGQTEVQMFSFDYHQDAHKRGTPFSTPSPFQFCDPFSLSSVPSDLTGSCLKPTREKRIDCDVADDADMRPS
mmetsp:Transcript_30522/g.59994  ORF Transcript_30522/g.59994 Transcript_30522/m.59994 type:complete len:168 (+) Transcript_30522:297-800(+)